MASADDLAADDAQAGFGGILEPGQRPVLLLVDLALAYFESGSPLYAGVENIIEPNLRLIATARATRTPIVFTRVEYQDGTGGRDGGLFYRKIPALRCFDAGNRLGDFHAQLMPEPRDMIVTKQYPSAFFGTPLASNLHAMGIDTCIIAGLSTSGCVRATTLDALCHGFVPIVVRDACGDREAAIHEANLFDLQTKYAEIVDCEQACSLLMS